jgi:hypothetical protein
LNEVFRGCDGKAFNKLVNILTVFPCICFGFYSSY